MRTLWSRPELERWNASLSHAWRLLGAKSAPVAEPVRVVLLRAKSARLSPLHLMALCAMSLLTLASGVFALRSAMAPVTLPIEAKQQWRTPVALSDAARGARAPPALDTQTLSRPLFSKSRRPSEAQKRKVEAHAAGPSTIPAGMTLRAIINFGQDTQVFLVTNATSDGVWLKVGEQIEGWTLTEVSPTEVTMRNGDKTARLEFEYEDQSPTPGLAAPGLGQPKPGLFAPIDPQRGRANRNDAPG